MRFIIYFFLFVISYSSSCNSQKEKTEDTLEKKENIKKIYEFPFDMKKPDESQVLPEKLKEISGLSMSESGLLYAIQDENGLIFRINGDDIKEFEFRKDGDYEGIEVVGDYVYVVKSSGTVYKISNLGKDNQTREDFNDFLDDEHDVEGLSYHAPSNCLLLACKSHGDEHEDKRSIYKFDLSKNKVLEKPMASISVREVVSKIKEYAFEYKDEAFATLVEKKGDELTFAPSAIAIHPITNNFYITSSKGKLLMVADSNMKLLHIEKLDKSIHEQPEGLAFDKKGNLFISNEGKEKTGMIYKFNYTLD